MATYDIVKTIEPFDTPLDGEGQPFVIDTEKNSEDARILCYLYAKEHADKIGADLLQTSMWSWKFLTSNGTTVRYKVV